MKYVRIRPLLCVLLLALATAAFAQSKLPKVEFTDTTLDNGLRVIIAPEHTAPVFSISLTYNTGSRNEKQGRTGFAHLFEHMMFEGSANVGKGEHMLLVQNYGGSLNGSTNNDQTNYFEELPKNQLDMALFLESDRMKALNITQANLDNQRNAVQEERRLRVDNQPYGKSFEELESMAYDNFAYHHSVIGSMDDLNAATLDDVKDFFRIYYAPNNVVMVLAGDLDPKETLAKVKKYFGGIPRQEAPKRMDLAEAAKTAERRLKIEDPLARLTRVDIAYRMPEGTSADARALSIAASVLGGGGGGFGGRGGGGGGNNSRLYQKLVVEKEVASQVSASAQRRAGPGMFHISATVRPGHTPEEVEGLISEEIAKLHGTPVTDPELARARMGIRRGAENRITALSRAQALADAA
ncbi:MAG TPA: pitrilysin family protein, partial [Candidatus Angelobacter sp.]|nr:pitrilysin family protein [Candidatus Angelobacter sp.]